MQTRLSGEFEATPDGEEAAEILRKCVHCGFCNATCPTYLLTGDELDGPRGRIYQIKQVLEGAPVTRSIQRHLDRCLTCRNCETTCPSGVEYGHLLDIGRDIVDERLERPLPERAVRWILKEGLPSPLFAPALRVGGALRPVLPASLRAKVPVRGVTPVGADAPAAARVPAPSRRHLRQVLILEGCVQPAMRPNINRATLRVLDAAGIGAVSAPGAGCCGAIRFHLSDRDGALADMRRNVDAWWPMIASGEVDCIVINASGCSVAVKDYGHALARDPAYAQKAARISATARDLSELLPEIAAALKGRLRPRTAGAVALHTPCTLQHGQRLRGGIEPHLRALGIEVAAPAAEAHLCCGSAGTYSVLQPELSTALRDRKLAALGAQAPDCIASANIGCIQQLQSGTATPVRHWIEIIEEALVGDSADDQQGRGGRDPVP